MDDTKDQIAPQQEIRAAQHLSGPGTNRLIHESSPYLLQHAHNPVDWYPWCAEAFEKASQDDKPVLVSIGYSACHWCHVMEKESFENTEVAAFMNRHFVNIKVDREERPDIDHIYMDAVQVMVGGGGWPLNVFLTPAKKPFYGGTYFPPVRSFNKNSWMEILSSVALAYKEKKDQVELQAENLTAHLIKSNQLSVLNRGPANLSKARMDEAFQNLMKMADQEWGGFGNAPKFPQTYSLTFLLRYSHVTGNKQAKDHALLTLEKMIGGGIYDQIGGGFSRYATDTEWLAPHFEKMLYDNALLVLTLTEAYQLTGNDLYKEAVVDTLAFVEREMKHEEGGFFSALDADSEGVEGKFYVWEEKEVMELVTDRPSLFCAYFDISAKGNWEEKNILRTSIPLATFAFEHGLETSELKALINKGRKQLLEARNQRIRPRLDDKILLGWNALMCLAYCRAYGALGDKRFLAVAEENMGFLLEKLGANGLKLSHTWKKGTASQPAFLDDYNYLIMSLIELAQVSANYQYLEKARELMERVLTQFSADDSHLFGYTSKDQADVLLQKKEIYDAATPSANAIMAYNLLRLAKIYNKKDWEEKGGQMIQSMLELAVKYPTSFSTWLCIILEQVCGTNEVVILGEGWQSYLVKTLKIYAPHKIIMAGRQAEQQYVMMANKRSDGEILIYVCKDYVCNQPVTTIERLISLLSFK